MIKCLDATLHAVSCFVIKLYPGRFTIAQANFNNSIFYASLLVINCYTFAETSLGCLNGRTSAVSSLLSWQERKKEKKKRKSSSLTCVSKHKVTVETNCQRLQVTFDQNRKPRQGNTWPDPSDIFRYWQVSYFPFFFNVFLQIVIMLQFIWRFGSPNIPCMILTFCRNVYWQSFAHLVVTWNQVILTVFTPIVSSVMRVSQRI